MRFVLFPLLAAAWLAIGALHLFDGGGSAGGKAGPSPLLGPRNGPTLRILSDESAASEVRPSGAVPIGTTVRVAGQGFLPGSQIRITYAVAETGFAREPVARAAVGSNGRFQVAFTISRTIAAGARGSASERYPGAVQPLLVEAYSGSSPHAGQRSATAALLIYCPTPPRPIRHVAVTPS
jgi:hypothetical protein